MTAWVLVLAFGTNVSMVVPGIASEKACLELRERMVADMYYPYTGRCFSYEAAKND